MKRRKMSGNERLMKSVGMRTDRRSCVPQPSAFAPVRYHVSYCALPAGRHDLAGTQSAANGFGIVGLVSQHAVRPIYSLLLISEMAIRSYAKCELCHSPCRTSH